MNQGFYVPCAPFLYLVPDSVASPGMELQQRSPGPFHYLINEQAKSLVALQELQNEVGALLEFRDLVMDTFPHLRTKMAPPLTSAVSPSPPSHIPIPLATSLNVGRREWEPGIRVRRKIPTHKDPLDTSLTRRKTSSHQPKSGDTLSAGSSAVQDSGFSTETSSTKETMTSPPKEIPSTGSGISSGLDEAEDELWNLLDVIHRKGTKLREEVECLQVKLTNEREEKRPLKDDNNSDFERLCKTSLDGGEGLAFIGDISDIKDLPRIQQEFKPGGSMRCVMEGADLANNLESNIKDKFRNSKLLLNLGGGEMSCDENAEARELKFERDYLLDKLSEMEAETLATRARASQLKTEVSSLVAAKRDLEEQLKTAVTQKSELNTRIHDLHIQFVGKPTTTTADNKKLVHVPSSKKPLPNQQTSFIRPPSGAHLRGPSGFTPVQPSRTLIPKPSLNSVPGGGISPQNSMNNATDAFRVETSDSDLRISKDTNSDINVRTSEEGGKNGRTRDVSRKEVRLQVRLGTLDGIVSNPSRVARGVAPDRRKVAAILGEFNPLELQRHLLTTAAENQDLQQRLDVALTSHSSLQLHADKTRDDNDELRFLLEKRNIELEGTRAQVRVLERLHAAKPADVLHNQSQDSKQSYNALHNQSQDSKQSFNVLRNQSQDADKTVDAARRTSFVVENKASDVRNKLSYDVHGKPSYDVHHSSTESSHDVVTTKSDHSSVNDMSSVDPVISPKKRPSKIPLGTKLYTAPKPPSSVAAKPATKGKDGAAPTSLGKGSVGRNSSLSQKNSLNGKAREANGKRDSLNGSKMNSFSSNVSGGGRNSLSSTGRKSFTRQASTTQRARTAVKRSDTVVIDNGSGGDAAHGKMPERYAGRPASTVCYNPTLRRPLPGTRVTTAPVTTTPIATTLVATTPVNTTPHITTSVIAPSTLYKTTSSDTTSNFTPLPIDRALSTTPPSPLKTSVVAAVPHDRTPLNKTTSVNGMSPKRPVVTQLSHVKQFVDLTSNAAHNVNKTPSHNTLSRDSSSIPWNHSSSEYFDSINNSSFLNTTSQLHSCTDLREECFDSTQNEAMADYDSLELDVPIRSGKLIMARNIWVTADSMEDRS